MASQDRTAGAAEGRQRPPSPTVSTPKGGGAIHGIGEKFAANPVTGTGSVSIPLPTSPGRSGFEPRLSLSYDSGAGNGPFGFGWTLSLPAITRRTDKGLPQYRDAEESDVFVMAGMEDLVPVLRTDGTRFRDDASAPGFIIDRYRPRVEGSFIRIERWTRSDTGEMHWRCITPDDVTTIYGDTDASRIADPSSTGAAPPTGVFSWLPSASWDDRGNAMVFEYAGEDDANVDRAQANERNRARSANRYLKRVRYGNLVSRLVEPDLTQAAWAFEVVFDYDEGHCEDLPLDPAQPEDAQHHFVRASASPARSWSVRPDPFSTYRSGFEVRSYRRCRRVLLFHHIPDLPTGEPGYDGLVRATELDYADIDYAAPVAIDDELAWQGSTRFASFIRSVTQSGYVRDDTRPVVMENGVPFATYLKRSLPPLELEYSKASIQADVHVLDPASLENLPAGLDGVAHHWVDLDGEGVSGILVEETGSWSYKPNLGDGRFGPMEPVAARPSLAALREGSQQLVDLSGDGQLDLAAFAGPTPGFYERTLDARWAPFRAFRELPDARWDDPNLRFVDLDGDGRADVLVAESAVFTCHLSLAEEGFAPARLVRHPPDEEHGPRLVFADGEQTIYLADMSGDGLTDLVRIRNGEVCYWPNLGYGRFGARVAMDDAPRFDRPDRFDQRRIRLADVDGSGTNDIIYLGHDGARIYFNQSGNRWSAPRPLPQFPHLDDVTSVTAADLLGNGTACLVWSSPLPADTPRPLRYLDLMGGVKPHLLVRVVNDLGAETVVRYAPSTRFYLADKRDGRPWVTRLPFPVHVVERVETYDHVSGNRFVTRHAYHHGHYDGVEREFRGFGMVEQWDTEELSALASGGALPVGTNEDASSHVPPVYTRSWFHTGVYVGRERVSTHLAHEYWREPGLDDAAAAALLLDDTILPDGLTADEEREACRALKGSLLRQEVYALDGTAMEPYPYSVTERNFGLRVLQPRDANRHAVFLAHERETLDYHYERDPADPRVAHALTLDIDDFGNVLVSAAVGYGRRAPDPALAPADQARQAQILATCAVRSYTNAVDTTDAWRAPLPSEARSFELTGLAPAPGAPRLAFADVAAAVAAASEIAYEEAPTSGLLQKRLIARARTLYRRDDLTGALPLASIEPLALPFESYALALTPGLVASVYGGRATDAMLADEGRYVHAQGDPAWWVPSGQSFYTADPNATAAQELDEARQHFFLPRRFRDPFHTSGTSTEHFVAYDRYHLLVQETLDAFGNRVTAGERAADPALPPVRLAHDYRVLQPALVMDPNRNRTAVAFDALGMVVGTAVMGKPEESPVPGDRLGASFRVDLTPAEVTQILADPKGPAAAALLGDASTRVVYDVDAFRRDAAGRTPVVAATFARETHASDPVPAGGVRIQASLSYSDGFGREIQKKSQAEPGPTPVRDASGAIVVGADGLPEMTASDTAPRWVGSGWTVFDNKGNPVRQYEPFFTDTHHFEFDVRIGVSPILCRDPLGRVVATVHADHSWQVVRFDPWRVEQWDANDTVLLDATLDDVAGPFVRRLPDADYLPTWYAQRSGGALGAAEQDAASKTSVHAATPALLHADSLGRTVLTVAQNRFVRNGSTVEERYETRALLDIEGQQREVRDANGRVAMRYDYDLLGHTLHHASMEAGERWTLADVAGTAMRAWDSRANSFRTTFDALRRPVASYVSEGGGAERLFAATDYGETEPAPEAANLRGKVVRHRDQAGVATSDRYDFKGNPLRTGRQVAREYRQTLDWTDPATVALEAETFGTATTYDALNRPTAITTPDQSVYRPTYNDAGLLETVNVSLRGAPSATPFVSNLDYDAKGRRTLISYGNGTSTAYEYDQLTFRLRRLTTTRATDHATLQDLAYAYDPSGNVTFIEDGAQQSVYFANQIAAPRWDYTYDAVYRLVGAGGREHAGQAGQPQTTWDDAGRVRLPHPGDAQAMLPYAERYEYDAVGNFRRLVHQATGGSWTRTYAYGESSQLESGQVNNRLTRTTVGTAPDESYGYDAHGNTVAMPHLSLVEWDYKDQLRASASQVVGGGSPETTWYVYDSAGQRVRKVTDAAGGASRKDERIYLGGFELYREYDAGGAVSLERETLHVVDDAQRVALVETRTLGDDGSAAQLVRYQYGNHLGSASLELNETGAIVSYEEYYPYGSTSYQAGPSAIEVSRKRYRFTGMERDEETGFGYHGARYYAPWLGRWVSADPAGPTEGTNLYWYVRANPVVLMDRTGTDGLPGPFTPFTWSPTPAVPPPPPPPVAPPVAPPTPPPVVAPEPAAATGLAPEAAPVAEGFGEASAGAAGIVGALAFLGALAGNSWYHMYRSGSIARYGNPYGIPHDSGFPQSLEARARRMWTEPPPAPDPTPQARIVPKPGNPPTWSSTDPTRLRRTDPEPDTSSPPKTDKDERRRKKRRVGRIYVTYVKIQDKTGRVYTGRTDMVVDLDAKDFRLQALIAMRTRGMRHHMDEKDYSPASVDDMLDAYAVGTAANRGDRYWDDAYLAIRGREQQSIDFWGGAQTDRDEAGLPGDSGNAIRAVAKENTRWGRVFDKAATRRFGRLYEYTGY